MVDHTEQRQAGNIRMIRLDTLIKLRWLAVAGQLVAVLIVNHAFGFPLPMFAAIGIISVSAVLNLALRARFHTTHRMNDGAAASLLAFDVVQLAALLYLTGGLENPFAILFLAPVMISATALPPRRTLMLGALAMAATTVLALWHQPLPWVPGETLRLPQLYIVGVWLSILLGLTFIGIYAWRVADEARQLGDALAATELVLAREQHLSQLDGLAAAAAHELGTPLATIALVVGELDRATKKSDPHKDDIELLKQQTTRCRQILSKITTLGTEPAGPLVVLSLKQLIEEVTAPQRAFGVSIKIDADGTNSEPDTKRSPGLFYGLENLIDNAVDFAASTVCIEARWTAQEVVIRIFDDGPGFAPEVLNRLGEPYVTSRGTGLGDRKRAGGLGLGLFIAKTLLERSGAAFEARNRTGTDKGADITLTWARSAFEYDLALQKA
ncbi:MAG: ActS/PrrB/RegB family redox-sensitive histidine kinase [Beijerinckiaceae bacterium]